MPDESGEGGSPDEVSRVDGLKDRLKDAGQKVSAASKKACLLYTSPSPRDS